MSFLTHSSVIPLHLNHITLICLWFSVQQLKKGCHYYVLILNKNEHHKNKVYKDTKVLKKKRKKKKERTIKKLNSKK